MKILCTKPKTTFRTIWPYNNDGSITQPLSVGVMYNTTFIHTIAELHEEYVVLINRYNRRIKAPLLEYLDQHMLDENWAQEYEIDKSDRSEIRYVYGEAHGIRTMGYVNQIINSNGTKSSSTFVWAPCHGSNAPTIGHFKGCTTSTIFKPPNVFMDIDTWR